MLSSISWTQYATTVAICLIIYYFFVAYKYFKWEILSLIGIKKMEPGIIVIPENYQQHASLNKEPHEDYLPKENITSDNILKSFTDEIRAYLQSTADTLLSKADLINSLQAIAAKYPSEILSGDSIGLRQFVLAEIAATYPGLLTIEDIAHLWL